ncbi:MAG: DUF1385 domain-containing protein [Lachnospiraceae bacterium]|nr:DUF1385 domain-containing protein [Lachnospiraceae bacterium]
MKSSGIGGQAVLEGVMMKNKSCYAVAVRKPDGEISVEKGNCKSIGEKSVFFRLPIIRGVVAFVESLILGMQTLTYSSGFYEEEGGETEKNEKIETIENILIVLLSIILAVGFFMLLPFFLSELLRSKIHSQTTLAVVEGILRIVLFVGYVIAISCMKDIKRVFMYHGAEHKTINCVENGLDLTVENVRQQSKQHRRCGTSFLLIVMFISIIFFIFIHIDNICLRMLFRILLVPVIAGISFEFIRWAGNTDNKVVILLSKPGMLLQCLTTREPDDKMIEVAIASVEAVFDWKEYQRRSLIQAKRQEEKKKKKVLADRSEKTDSSGRKVKKSRAQLKKELAEREQEYRNRAKERARMLKEQEEREAALERKYKDIEKRNAARLAAAKENNPAPKIEIDIDDELEGLDHYFDSEPEEDSDNNE